MNLYVVTNLTNKTITLTDLRAEIGPHKVLDLERVADRFSIDRSYDLQVAMQNKLLRLVKHTVIRTNRPVEAPPPVETRVIERTIEKQVNNFDEQKLAAIVRQVMNEQKPAQPQPDDMADTKNDLKSLLESIRSQLNSVHPVRSDINEPGIDPSRLADLQQKSIEKMSQEIETGGQREVKKIKITNTNLKNLAGELD